ncbi:MAG: SMC-Scp complex subunit ScpB [Candidatus Bipolaricaulota bacterium]|nr:SMC-Scp complex subunit ScpB [Candidatus Bipolaricaulota bacterium]
MLDREETDIEHDQALVEAALFLSPEPLTRHKLARIIGGTSLAYVERLLGQIEDECRGETHGIELHVEDGKSMFQVKRPYIDAVAHLAPHQDIPRPVLRSLAMIAYNHPLTQSDLVKARGNKAYKHVQELLERRLIRAEDQGRTLLLYVTDEFLRYFGLSNVEEFRFHVGDLPEEPEEIEQETEELEKTEDTEDSGEEVSQEVDDG